MNDSDGIESSSTEITMCKKEMIKLIENLASSLYSASFARRNEKLFDIMKAPKEGDYVLEKTTLGNNRFGKLKKKCREPFDMSEEQKKECLEAGDKIPQQDVYYIVTPEGNLFRWYNAIFIKVPSEAWSCWDIPKNNQ